MGEGEDHLRHITRFMAVLALTGVVPWGLFRSWRAALAWLVGAGTSFAFWALHQFLTGRMLNPKVRIRWFYGFLSLGKLALIAFVLRGMIGLYPEEALPLALGILLFVAAILIEAVRLGFQKPEAAPPS